MFRAVFLLHTRSFGPGARVLGRSVQRADGGERACCCRRRWFSSGLQRSGPLFLQSYDLPSRGRKPCYAAKGLPARAAARGYIPAVLLLLLYASYIAPST